MTITEHVAYIRGLFEGLEVSADKKEGRILKEVISVLEEIAQSVADLEEENEALMEIIDTMVEDIYDDDSDDDDVDSELDFDPDTELFEVVCPSCGEEIFVDDETLEQGNISCPACGEELEFDLSALDDETDDDDILRIPVSFTEDYDDSDDNE